MIKRRKPILLSLIVVLLLIGGFFAIHWFTTVDAENMDGLSRQATAYLQSDEPMYINEVERQGNFLAALCSTVDGKMALCVFDQDPVFENRWKANGGKRSLTAGEISSWNYGSSDGEAVLVFCGGEIPEEVCWYTFTNDGIIYTCPVEEHRVLDIFIIQDSNDINSYPKPLDQERQEIK